MSDDVTGDALTELRRNAVAISAIPGHDGEMEVDVGVVLSLLDRLEAQQDVVEAARERQAMVAEDDDPAYPAVKLARWDALEEREAAALSRLDALTEKPDE